MLSRGRFNMFILAKKIFSGWRFVPSLSIMKNYSTDILELCVALRHSSLQSSLSVFKKQKKMGERIVREIRFVGNRR